MASNPDHTLHTILQQTFRSTQEQVTSRGYLASSPRTTKNSLQLRRSYLPWKKTKTHAQEWTFRRETGSRSIGQKKALSKKLRSQTNQSRGTTSARCTRKVSTSLWFPKTRKEFRSAKSLLATKTRILTSDSFFLKKKETSPKLWARENNSESHLKS